MFEGLNRLLAASAVAGAAFVLLVAPSTALACSGGPSAVNVYKECLPTGGGGKPTGVGAGGNGASTPSGHISSRAADAIRHAGKDSRVLSTLVHGSGPSRLLQPPDSSRAANSPTALGSAFDLGSGPTTLLIVLAGTAALLLGGSGIRLWRTRHRP